MFIICEPGWDGGQFLPEDVAEHAVHHANRGEAGALIVVTRQLGGQGVVGGGGHGMEGVHQPEAEQHGKERCRTGQSLGQGKHDAGRDAQRYGADQHVDPPAAEAGAGAV